MNIWKIKPVDISYEESIPVINAMEENLTLDETQLDYVQPLPASYSDCLLYTSPSPRDGLLSRMPSSA